MNGLEPIGGRELGRHNLAFKPAVKLGKRHQVVMSDLAEIAAGRAKLKASFNQLSNTENLKQKKKKQTKNDK